MTRWSRIVWVALALALALSPASAQRRHDPLNDQEIDQLRDAAQKPDLRLKLYIKFTQARFLALDELRADPKAGADRGQRIHDLLSDIDTLVNELGDNLDEYGRPEKNPPKLGAVIAATADWHDRLADLKEAAAKDPQVAREARDYYFVLDSAIDSVNDLADDARQMLAEQESRKKH